MNLIASTKTETGLTVRAQLDTEDYPTGRQISEEELSEIDLRRDSFTVIGTMQSSHERTLHLSRLFRRSPLAFLSLARGTYPPTPTLLPREYHLL